MVIFTNQIRMQDRRDVRQPGDHDRRQRAQVLRLGPARRAPHRRRSRTSDEAVGNQTRVKVVKNKVAPPFRVVEFDIMYGEGISKTGELIDLGVKAGVVEKSGAWFSYKSQRIGQGRENAKTYLREHPEIAAEIEQTSARMPASAARASTCSKRTRRRWSEATRQLMLHMISIQRRVPLHEATLA